MATSRAPRTPARPAAPLAAYVLHSYDWSETSLIVELFTRSQGRLVVAAKGAKRPNSALRAVLMPFQPLQVLLGRTPADAQAEVLNLRSAEWVGGQPLLGPAALLPGFYMNELLLKLLARQDAHPGVFDAYADALASLGALQPGQAEGPTLRALELALLHGLGLLPDLSQHTLTAEPLQPDAPYTLDPQAGLRAVPGGALAAAMASQALPGAAWTRIAAALLHGAPAALRAVCTPVAGSLRTPLRGLLQYHLDGAPLRTRQVRLGMQMLVDLAPPVRSTQPATA